MSGCGQITNYFLCRSSRFSNAEAERVAEDVTDYKRWMKILSGKKDKNIYSSF